jgi:hypothetical protein
MQCSPRLQNGASVTKRPSMANRLIVLPAIANFLDIFLAISIANSVKVLVGVRGFEPPAPAFRKQHLRSAFIGDDLGRIKRPAGVNQEPSRRGSGIIARSALSAMAHTWRSRNVGESFIAGVPAHSTQLPSREALGRLRLVGWKIN